MDEMFIVILDDGSIVNFLAAKLKDPSHNASNELLHGALHWTPVEYDKTVSKVSQSVNWKDL